MRRLIALLSLLTLAAFQGSPAVDASQHHRESATPDLVETAVAAGSFKTLVAALEAADLVSTLQGDGPFTVFAPTDAAFDGLADGTVETLLRPENRDALRALLTYHVIAGQVSAADAGGLKSAATVNGQRLDLSFEEGRLRVDRAIVQTADIRTANGVIHVIDRVLLPEDRTLVALAQGAGTFNTLLAAAEAAGLVDTLTGDGPLTLFAPTDAAFAKLPAGTVENLLAEEGRRTLTDILTYHVVPGRVFSGDALAAGNAATVNGEGVAIRITEGRLRVNEARVVSPDLEAANGVIHVIDEVLLPPSTARPAADRGRTGADRVIRLAIERGVPLFNNGDPAACAAVYEVASTSLLEGGYDLPADARKALEMGLSEASRARDETARAWALRYGLDGANRALRGRMSAGSH